MTVMLFTAALLASIGATVMIAVRRDARRSGYTSSTVFSRRRAARAVRLAARPVPSAGERIESDTRLRRARRSIAGVVPRRRRIVPHASYVFTAAPAVRSEVDLAVAVTASSGQTSTARDAGAAADESGSAQTAAAAPAAHAARATDPTVRLAESADAQAETVQRVVVGFDGVEADPQMLAELRRRRAVRPEVIEADPIGADVIDPGRFSGAR